MVGADGQVPRTWAKRLRSVKALHAFLGSNEATYSLREGGAGFHRNRPAAGKAKPTLSAGIVRRVRNPNGRYGLPKRMVERALLEAYQNVVLDQRKASQIGQ